MPSLPGGVQIEMFLELHCGDRCQRHGTALFFKHMLSRNMHFKLQQLF